MHNSSELTKLLIALDENIPIGLVILAQDLTIAHVNGYIKSQLGATTKTLQGTHFNDVFTLISNANSSCFADRVASCTTGTLGFDQTPGSIEVTFVNALGVAQRLSSLMCCPFTDSDGNRYSAIVFFDPSSDDQWGFHYALERAVKNIRSLRSEEKQLVAKLESGYKALVHSEKLAAIGQMAAGITHEINNPIGYIFSNLQVLKDYVDDLMKIVDAIEHAKSLDELKQLTTVLDYEYIRNDVRALLTESGEGMVRVKEIISELQDFYHVDEKEFSLADIHAGIDTSINIATNELRYKADIIRDYGHLPVVECNISQINQVILNLLMNAGEAIDMNGVITVRTCREQDKVWIDVEDNGTGIPPEILDKVFEPFFTTKQRGKGTGLGLALSYTIIKRHHGDIEVFSQVGVGTRFRVWLPISQPLIQEDNTEVTHAS